MTVTPFRYTTEQEATLADNERFILAGILDDGDLLILEDAGPMGGRYEGGHIAKHDPWILTRDGKVQGLSYHYQYHHELGAPLDGPIPLPREPSPALDTSLLITLDSARVYLAEVYGIEFTTRTLRNYCASGKLDCVRLAGKSNRPWYTKAAALQKLAEPVNQVEDLAPLPSDDPRFEVVDA